MSSQMLLSQINMLLDFNLLKNDKFIPSYESTSVGSIIEDTVAMIQLQANYHNV